MSDDMSAIPLVYVAGAFSAPTPKGVVRNIERAVAVGIEIARLGACPVIPHSNTAHPEFNRCQSYDFWCAATLGLMRRCDAVVMVEGWERSRGATAERADALSRGMPVHHTLKELQDWMKGQGNGKK